VSVFTVGRHRRIVWSLLYTVIIIILPAEVQLAWTSLLRCDAALCGAGRMYVTWLYSLANL